MRPFLVSVFLLAAFGGSVAHSKAGTPRSGAQLFKTYCAKCHVTSGPAGQSPTLHRIFKRVDEQQFRTVVMNGRNTMPPFSERLSDKEVNRLAAYLKTK